MSFSLPASQEIRTIVAEELALVGGTVSDVCEDSDRLFLRSLIPLEDEVQPKDVVQGGVAVMADKEKIHVHPYLLRKVCRNGAIMPQLLQDRSIQRVDSAATSDEIAAVETELREEVRACSAPEIFSNGVTHFRMSTFKPADMNVFGFILQLTVRQKLQRPLVTEIMRRFSENSNRSMFDLVNAVTSVARDQGDDPDVRWQLEELGGGMLAMRLPWAKPSGSAAKARNEVKVCV
jgi:hypothetical protein